MMKRSLTISAVVLSSLLSLPTLAFVKNPSYVSVQAGVAVPHGKLLHETVNAGLLRRAPRTAAVFDIHAGTKVFTNTYVELEFAYARHNFRNNYKDDNDIYKTLQDNSFATRLRTISGFANLSYKFQNLSAMVIPYIVAGVGASSNRVQDMRISVPSHGFVSTSKGKSTVQAAWQVGAGVLVPVVKNISIDLSYKYRDLGRVKTTNVFNTSGAIDTTSSSALAGRIRTSNILLGVNINL
jgi:opacity protein-like surface antigen